jgi:hypothetical protein
MTHDAWSERYQDHHQQENHTQRHQQLGQRETKRLPAEAARLMVGS